MIVRSADDGLEVLPWHEAVRVHVTEVTALGGGSKLGRSAQRRGHRLGWRAVRIYVVGSTLCARRTSMARRASPVSPLSSIVLMAPTSMMKLITHSGNLRRPKSVSVSATRMQQAERHQNARSATGEEHTLCTTTTAHPHPHSISPRFLRRTPLRPRCMSLVLNFLHVRAVAVGGTKRGVLRASVTVRVR